jgi:hypothetical protein
MAGGLNFKFIFYFTQTTVAHRQMEFGTVKDHGHTSCTSLIWIIIFFDGALEYDDGAEF